MRPVNTKNVPRVRHPLKKNTYSQYKDIAVCLDTRFLRLAFKDGAIFDVSAERRVPDPSQKSRSPPRSCVERDRDLCLYQHGLSGAKKSKSFVPLKSPLPSLFTYF